MSEREISDLDSKDGLSGAHGDDRGKSKGSYKNKFKRAKRMVLFPFRKVNKLWRRTTPSSESGNGCYLCFMPPPRSLNSPMRSQTNETGDQEFSYEFLKTLIEKNDFYCEECNVHTSR